MDNASYQAAYNERAQSGETAWDQRTYKTLKAVLEEPFEVFENPSDGAPPLARC